MMAYLRILRPINVLFIGLCVLAGAWWRNPTFVSGFSIWGAVLSAMLIGGAGYVVNDFFDLPIDLINRPRRPIPSGQISPKSAFLYSMLLFTLGIGFSWSIANLFAVLLAMINTLLLFFYARRFKREYLTGNIVIGLLTVTPFVYGGIAAHNARYSLFLGIFAGILTLIREFVKDLEDAEGDRLTGARTLAIVSGVGIVLIVSTVLLVLFSLLALLAWRQAIFSSLVFGLLMLSVVFPIAGFLVYTERHPMIRTYSRFSAFLKCDMLIALSIVLLLAR